MLASANSALARWSDDWPDYGTLLACHAFAAEECGDYAVAEPSGRAALARDPGDFWAAHAVAHILEMQGRRTEGIALLTSLERHWQGGSNIVHHLFWHRAMFHLECREFDAVLALYDKGFRDLASPLVAAQPDVYIDIQNAASMLFRLRRHGVDVGARWDELADKAESRIGDCLSAFTLPHWMMALAATGREAAAQRMLAAIRAFAANEAAGSDLIGAVALPVTEAAFAHGRGEHARALDLMRPVLNDMPRLGGSHAQQDVLEQMYLDAAMKAGRADDVRAMLARVAERHPLPPGERIGYAEAARLFAPSPSA
jgi:hypothetical protein